MQHLMSELHALSCHMPEAASACRNPAKIKDWIDAVYQKKRFYSGEALSRVSTSSSQPVSRLAKPEHNPSWMLHWY